MTSETTRKGNIMEDRVKQFQSLTTTQLQEYVNFRDKYNQFNMFGEIGYTTIINDGFRLANTAETELNRRKNELPSIKSRLSDIGELINSMEADCLIEKSEVAFSHYKSLTEEQTNLKKTLERYNK